MKCGETLWRPREKGACKNPVRFSIWSYYRNRWCMLDWVVEISEIHFFGMHISAQLVSAQQNEMLLRLAGMNYVKIRTHCKA